MTLRTVAVAQRGAAGRAGRSERPGAPGSSTPLRASAIRQRFFDLLRALGFDPICHAFPDHHRYTRADLAFPDAAAILMTEKDAVKCAAFADGRCWYLPIRARIEPALVARLERTIRGRQAA